MRPLEDELGDIESVAVDPKEIRQWDREYAFLKLATDLMREAAQYTCVLACAFAGERDYWTRNEAILGGHLVRLFKLMRHGIEQARDKQTELLWVTVRLAVECTINFRFLLAHRTDTVFDSYVYYSLQHERDLLRKIQGNVEARGGEVLPIEARMRESIAKAFRNSGIDPQDLPERRIRNWGEKKLFERAVETGLADAYLGTIGGPSSSVHGNWGDLRQNHLEVIEPLRFRPDFDPPPVRPQPFFTLTTLVLPGLMEYTEGLGVREAPVFIERLADLLKRNDAAEEFHEEFLVRRRENTTP